LPLGGVSAHEGSALALAIDGLSGALSGAECSNPEPKRHGNARVFMAIKIAAFTEKQTFIGKIGQLINHVKSSKPSRNTDRVLMPGEPEAINRKKSKTGGIVVDEASFNQLRQQGEKVGLDLLAMVPQI